MSHELLDAVVDRGDAVLRELDGIRYLTYPVLNELHGIRAITTLRGAGGSAQGAAADSFLADLMPWVARALGVPDAGLAAGRQVHGDEHVVITDESVPGPGELRRFDHTDALMTTLAGVALAVLTADCLPIFLADATARAVCMLHAGRVGTRKRIASQVASVFFDKLGARAERTVALVGPSIGDGCYPFRLWDDNVRQLRKAGIERVVNPRLCTACNLEHFYSYRAEKGFTGRMLSAIIAADS